MNRIFSKEYRLILAILSLSLLFAALVLQAIYPLHFGKQPLLFSDLFGFSLGLPIWIIYLFGLLDIFIFWLIGKILFKGIYVYLFMLFFSLSPWFIYSAVAGSYYIYLLFLISVTFIGIYLMCSNKQRIGGWLFIIGSVLILYSSLIFFVSYFLFTSGLIIFKVLSFNKIKFSLTIILIICIPLFIMMFRNTTGVKNILNNQINFLSDSGLKNNINMFQGESQREGYRNLSKLTENKYFYLFRYMILKFTKNLVPSTFFTAEEKLLDFSFTPPIYFGLILPFLYGLYLIISFETTRKYFFLSLTLILPSFFSARLVDINRLLLFEPIIIFTIIYGLKELNKRKSTRLILYSCLILVLIQTFVTVFDISFREYSRFERYRGIVYGQIDHQ